MDLSDLNDNQKQAVTAPLGPVLVLAGAGSGKTRALAYRIAWLCHRGLVQPESILALTFTNKAAQEMAGRVKRILAGRPCPVPHMGTFHSICARLLRRDIGCLGYSPGFSIYDAEDQTRAIRDIVKELGLDKRYQPSLFRHFISRAKNVLQSPGELALDLAPEMAGLVRQVYGHYQDYLYRQNAVDFDDLLMLTVKIFQNFPEVLKRYQAIFQYILVDEYQDTNPAQYELLRLLAAERHNLFVVGDDAQSIYGFRGSTVRNILCFEQDFPECLVVKLEQNYRSTANILAAAQKVIELNPQQKKKELWTENDAGRQVEVHELEDETEEARFVAEWIAALAAGQEPAAGNERGASAAEAGFSILDRFLKRASRPAAQPVRLSEAAQRRLGEFAVLFRTHAQSRALEEAFLHAGIHYRIVGGLRFYERKEIKDVLAYLRLAANYRDMASLQRVINEPARGIGEKTFRLIREELLKTTVGDADSGLESFLPKLQRLPLGAKAARAAADFFALLSRFSFLNPTEPLGSLLKLVIKTAGLEEWIRDGSELGESRWENVEELATVAEKFRQLPWREGLQSFLEEAALVAEGEDDPATAASRPAVTLMTLHSAKGLEFECVFLVGLEEGILPHSRSLLEPDELSEEIRLAYVGLTRARRRLFLSYARTRRTFGSLKYNTPSRILRSLPADRVVFRGTAGEFFSPGFPANPRYEPFDF